MATVGKKHRYWRKREKPLRFKTAINVAGHLGAPTFWRVEQTMTVKYEIDGAVGVVTLAKPPHIIRSSCRRRQIRIEFIDAKRFSNEHSRRPCCRNACGSQRREGVIADLGQRRAHPAVRPSAGWHRRIEMLDVILLVTAPAFFALCIGYVAACERV